MTIKHKDKKNKEVVTGI